MATKKEIRLKVPEAKGVGKRAKTEITMRESEEWSAEPRTIERVQTVCKLITDGMSRSSVQAYIMDNFDVKERQARCYYQAAMKYLQPEDEDEYRRGLLQANMDRLEGIMEKAMKDNNLKAATSAIVEMNKMLGIGGNKVQIARNNEGAEIININFD